MRHELVSHRHERPARVAVAARTQHERPASVAVGILDQNGRRASVAVAARTQHERPAGVAVGILDQNGRRPSVAVAPACRARSLTAAPVLALALALGGCASMGTHAEPKAPVTAPSRPDPDLDDITMTLQVMEMLPEGDPARQAELFESAKNAASLTPTTSNKLKLALALATPGHAGSDPVAAQRQLSELLATPETLLPVERLLAIVELKDVDQRLVLQAENKQLRDEAPRETRDKVQVANRRLAAESDENVRLRKALEEAQAKLEAVTHIERSINDRGTNGSHP